MYFKRKVPNIKLVHLLSCPEDEREQASVASLKPLEELGVQYIQHVNFPHEGEFPVHDNLLEIHKKSRVFGCFAAHQKAFMEEFSDDVDLLLVCECDCTLLVSHKRFLNAVVRFGALMSSKEIVTISIGALGLGKVAPTEGLYLSQIVTGTQCMLYCKTEKEIMREMFDTVPWKPFDIWLTEVLGNTNQIAVSEKRLTTQLPGPSLLGNDSESVIYKMNTSSGIGSLPSE